MGAHSSLSITWTLAILSGCGGSDLLLPGAGGPGDLVVVSGDGQEGQTGKSLDDPLVVQVNDGDGQPAPGVKVAFAGSKGSPVVDQESATTDSIGRASTEVRLGDAEGTQTVEARLAGASAGVSVEFHITAVAPGGGNGRGQGNNAGNEDED